MRKKEPLGLFDWRDGRAETEVVRLDKRMAGVGIAINQRTLRFVSHFEKESSAGSVKLYRWNSNSGLVSSKICVI